VHRGVLTRKEMSVALDSMSRNQQGKSHLLPALTTAREIFSRDASHFVIVMMAPMADLVDP
jgi:hypothetical protein